MVLGIARALGEADNSAEAEAWVPLVSDALRADYQCGETFIGRFEVGRKGLDSNGTHWGEPGNALESVGLEFEHVKAQRDDRWNFPTLARWLRENPNVRRAVIHTKSHIAFVDREFVYGAGARHRIIEAFVLEGEAEEVPDRWASGQLV